MVGSIACCYCGTLSPCFQAASRAVHSKPVRARGCTTDVVRRSRGTLCPVIGMLADTSSSSCRTSYCLSHPTEEYLQITDYTSVGCCSLARDPEGVFWRLLSEKRTGRPGTSQYHPPSSTRHRSVVSYTASSVVTESYGGDWVAWTSFVEGMLKTLSLDNAMAAC